MIFHLRRMTLLAGPVLGAGMQALKSLNASCAPVDAEDKAEFITLLAASNLDESMYADFERKGVGAVVELMSTLGSKLMEEPPVDNAINTLIASLRSGGSALWLAPAHQDYAEQNQAMTVLCNLSRRQSSNAEERRLALSCPLPPSRGTR